MASNFGYLAPIIVTLVIGSTQSFAKSEVDDSKGPRSKPLNRIVERDCGMGLRGDYRKGNKALRTDDDPNIAKESGMAMREAKNLADRGDLNGAIKMLEGRMAIDPQNYFLNSALGSYYFKAGRLADAIHRQELAVFWEGPTPHNLAILAKYYERSGDLHKTLITLNRSLDLDPENPHVIDQIVGVLRNHESGSVALRALHELRKRAPFNPDICAEILSLQLERQWDFSASRFADEILPVTSQRLSNKKDIKNIFVHALALTSKGRYREAFAAMETVVAAAKRSSAVDYLFIFKRLPRFAIRTAILAGKEQTALVWARQFLELRGRNTESQIAYVEAMMSNHKVNQIVEYVKNKVSKDGSNRTVEMATLRALMRGRYYNSALDLLDKLMEVYSVNADLLGRKAFVLLVAGAVDKAEETLQAISRRGSLSVGQTRTSIMIKFFKGDYQSVLSFTRLQRRTSRIFTFMEALSSVALGPAEIQNEITRLRKAVLDEGSKIGFAVLLSLDPRGTLAFAAENRLGVTEAIESIRASFNPLYAKMISPGEAVDPESLILRNVTNEEDDPMDSPD